MEVTATVDLTYQELWQLLESLPDDCSPLYDKLNAARVAFERPLQVYGNGAKIKPKSAALDALNERFRQNWEKITSPDPTDLF